MTERVVAIIQARMGSTRLPGKVLMPLAGKPVLWHLLHRLQQCRSLAAIAITTSEQPADDALVQFGEEFGVPVFRGPEDDVLTRYWRAAHAMDANYIVRATGDAPLIDPETIDLLVEALVAEKADYCIGASSQPPTIHEGFDPFSLVALDRLVAEAGTDPIALEHVTAYFKYHPDFGKTVQVELPEGYEIEGVRSSVDTPDDLLFLETLYQRLGAAPGDIDLKQVVQLLIQEPELKNINAHVKQKIAGAKYGRALFRCDGSAHLGLGHVVRCLALAEQLRDFHGMGVTFAVIAEDVGSELIRRHKFPVLIAPDAAAEADWLDRLITQYQPQVLVLDVRTNLDGSAFTRWRQQGVCVAAIDDPDPGRRNASDLVFYPPVPQLASERWEGFAGDSFIGWDYLLLRPEFSRPIVRDPALPLNIFVCMGGSDPAGFTLEVIKAVQHLTHSCQVNLILGRAFMYDGAISSLPASIQVFRDVKNIAELMQQADLAIAAFGGTAFELAALNVPTLLFALTPDHARSAQALVSDGMAILVPEERDVEGRMLAAMIDTLLDDPVRRAEIAQACRKIDGQGAVRVAAIIAERSCVADAH